MKKSYKELFIWESSVQLAVDILRLRQQSLLRTCKPLGDQMSRSAISIASNIAEGQGRVTDRDWRNFLGHARGSLFELETQLEIALRAGLVSEEDANRLTSHTAKIGCGVTRFMEVLRKRNRRNI